MLKFLITLLTFSILLFGCATKGYRDPTVDSSQLANIAIHETENVSLTNIEVNGIRLDFFSTSIDMLPGDYPFRLSYKEGTEACQNSEPSCHVKIAFGYCEGKISLKAGKKYLITVSARSGLVSVSVLAKGYYDFSVREEEGVVGRGSCVETSSYYAPVRGHT